MGGKTETIQCKHTSSPVAKKFKFPPDTYVLTLKT